MSDFEQHMRDAILSALAEGATTPEQIGEAMHPIIDAMMPVVEVIDVEATPHGTLNVRLEYQPAPLLP